MTKRASQDRPTGMVYVVREDSHAPVGLRVGGAVAGSEWSLEERILRGPSAEGPRRMTLVRIGNGICEAPH